MDSFYFVRQRHLNSKVGGVIALVSCFLLSFICIIKSTDLYIISILVMILGAICLCCGIISEKNGLYIENSKIIYRIRKKNNKININNIVAIKIVKSEAGSRPARPTCYLKDSNGNQLYTLFFLSEVIETMQKYSDGDINFLKRYRKYVIFYTIYDEVLIEYIKSKKSNVMLLK